MLAFKCISLTICHGCSKEPSHWDGSFEYPQHMFWLWNMKMKLILLNLPFWRATKNKIMCVLSGHSTFNTQKYRLVSKDFMLLLYALRRHVSFFHPSIHLSARPSVRPPTNPLTHPPTHPSAHQPTNTHQPIPTHTPIPSNPSFHQPIHHSTYSPIPFGGRWNSRTTPLAEY